MMTRKKIQPVIDAINELRQDAGFDTDLDVRNTGSEAVQ